MMHLTDFGEPLIFRVDLLLLYIIFQLTYLT